MQLKGELELLVERLKVTRNSYIVLVLTLP